MARVQERYGDSDTILNHRVRIASGLMVATAVLTLVTASAGVFYGRLYMDLVDVGAASRFAVAGAVNQDILSIPCALALAAISCTIVRSYNHRLLIVALGLVGYIFYGYAVYTFGVMVTPLYLIYIAIFALSTYSLIFGLMSFDSIKAAERLRLPRQARILVGVFLMTVAAGLSLKWVSDVMLETFRHTQPELYLIAAMDLGVALPAIGVSGAMTLANKAHGLLFSGIALIKVFTLCLSVALGTFVAPHYGLPADYGTLAFFAFLALISMALIVAYFRGLSIGRKLQ